MPPKRTRKSKTKQAEASSSKTSTPRVASESVRQPPTKRRRTLRGSLQNLPEMPLDILFEICCHLNPLDVLNLARTNKAFRTLLMNRVNVSFWTVARRNVEGLPECPSYLSEPAYANLVFCSHCHVCLKSNVRTIYWRARARYCLHCRETAMETNRYGAGVPTGLDIAKFVPFMEVIFTKYTCSAARKDDMVAIGSKYATFKDTKERGMWLNERRALTTQILEVEGSTFFCMQQSPHRRCQHSAKCVIWENAKKATRGRELVEIKKARYEAILGKLRALPDWEIEVEKLVKDSYSPLKRDPLIRQPKLLTEAGWLAVRYVLMPYMEKARHDRLHEIRIRVMKQRCYHLQEAVVSFRKSALTKFFPTLQDFATCPEVRAIIDVDSDINIDQESFEPLRPLVWDIVARWKEKQTAVLLEHIRSRLKSDEDCNVEFLATYFGLTCWGCSREIHSYPNILWHHCVGYSTYPSSNDYKSYVEFAYSSRAWDVSNFRFERPDIVNSIITACGMDFRTVSQEELDMQNPILVGRYDSEPGIKVVASWRAAIALALSIFVYRIGEWQWRLATSEEKISVAPLQSASELITQKAIEDGACWDCAHCLEGFVKRRTAGYNLTKSQVLDHVHTKHNIESPKEEEDYFLEFPRSDQISLHRPVYIKSKQAELNDSWLAGRIRRAMENGEVIEVDFLTSFDQKVE
ncbi:hypothetical protein NLI96_g10924 [Meripilus lineatus]|uniref:F-box domain-containing protein n=1 Tax=Meripilus lineatus TaxID=2056292 RepID=A0AAD5USP3_9APHY|nr:hypothetical protein NLI96_g10924 [Physisporinus lineatus]